MPSFSSDGAQLAYDDIPAPAGEDRTIVLVHGVASSRLEGWRRTGWYGAFERRGYRVVALDQRGHGESQKFYEPDAYLRSRMAHDLLALLDHLDLRGVDLFGYSMGAGVALEAAAISQDRIGRLMLGGVGGKLLYPPPELDPEAMAKAMLAEDVDAIEDELAQSFRIFAEEQEGDLAAIAACLRAPSPPPDPARLAAITIPALVLAGSLDDPAGDPEVLANALPNGRALSISGVDHFSAIPHALTKAAIFDFLDGLLDFPAFE